MADRAGFPWFALVSAGLLVACGPRPTETRHVAAAHAATQRSQACVVDGDGDAFGFAPFSVYASANDERSIAVVREPEAIGLRFTSFPEAAESGRAAVELSGNGLVRMRGFVELQDRRFQLAARVDVDAPHVFAMVGTGVRVRGWGGRGLEVEIPTPFESPRVVRAEVPCGGVAYRRESMALAPRSRVPLPELTSTEHEVLFFAEPGDRAVLRAEVTSDAPRMSLVDRRDGYAHVLVGVAPDSGEPGTLIVDAWVASRDVVLALPRTDRDSHGSIRDRMDHCPGSPRLGADTPLVLGAPGGPTIGVAEKDAYVVPQGTAGGFTQIEFVDGLVVAPSGSSFWVSDADVTIDCHAAPREDGCPCEGH
jgi:hypothetical protein